MTRKVARIAVLLDNGADATQARSTGCSYYLAAAGYRPRDAKGRTFNTMSDVLAFAQSLDYTHYTDCHTGTNGKHARSITTFLRNANAPRVHKIVELSQMVDDAAAAARR